MPKKEKNQEKRKKDLMGKIRLCCNSSKDSDIAIRWASKAWDSLRRANDPDMTSYLILTVIAEAADEGKSMGYAMLWGKLNKASAAEIEKREEKSKAVMAEKLAEIFKEC